MKVIPKHGAKCVLTGWVSDNEPVTVLAISYAPGVGSQFLILSKLQQSIALFASTEFDIVNNRVPRAWVTSIDLNGNVEFAPAEWLIGDFWDRYHGSDTAAERIFRECVKKIQEDEN